MTDHSTTTRSNVWISDYITHQVHITEKLIQAEANNMYGIQTTNIAHTQLKWTQVNIHAAC